MRILNGILAIVMVLFAVVQYNDPDGVFWAAVYGVGAVWCGLAAFRSGTFTVTPAFFLYIASLAAALFGVIWFWPITPGWWTQEVWWDTETAREGMGMMILTVALCAAGTVALRARRQ